ncbi:MAG: type IV pilin [Halobacteriota archaeon]
MDDRSLLDRGPMPTREAVVFVLGVTLVLTAIVGFVLFDFTEEEHVPQVRWTLADEDGPVLHHDGGDPVRCDRIRVEGDLGRGEDLCTCFDDQLIEEGDSARLMDPEGTAGTIVLAWHDVETDRTIPLAQFEYEPT